MIVWYDSNAHSPFVLTLLCSQTWPDGQTDRCKDRERERERERDTDTDTDTDADTDAEQTGNYFPKPRARKFVVTAKAAHKTLSSKIARRLA